MPATLELTSPAPACSEPELVAAVRRGSDRAFEELYSRYRGRIGSYIFGMVGDHARSEDLAQEVFIAALRRIRETERPIAFKPWLYEIARNACIDEFRRARRAREVPLQGSGEGADGDRELPAPGPTPDAAVESKESLDDLRGAFHGLSENHHRILVMRELEGLSYTQIGERLGMSKPMVESRLFRARRRLTEEYDELVSGRRCEHVQTLIDTRDERALGRLGIRERRQLSRHLSHCQPCRRHARMAGLDDAVLRAPTFAGKIAALLPFPWLRWRRGGTGASMYGPHAVAAVRTLPEVAGTAQNASPTLSAMGRAAAAVIAVAGLGGGIATTIPGSGSPRPAHHLASVLPAAPAAPPIVPAASTGAARSGLGAGANRVRHVGGSGGRPRGAAHPGSAASGSTPPGSSGLASAPGTPAGPSRSGSGSGGVSGSGGGGSGSGGSGGGSGGSGSGSSSGGAGAGVHGTVATATGAPSGTTSGATGAVSGAGAGATGAGSGLVTGVVAGAGGAVSGVVSGAGAVVSGAGNTAGGVVSTAGALVNGVGVVAGGTVGAVSPPLGTATSQLVGGVAGVLTKVVAPTAAGALSGVSSLLEGVASHLPGAPTSSSTSAGSAGSSGSQNP